MAKSVDIRKLKAVFANILAKQRKYSNTIDSFEVRFDYDSFCAWFSDQFAVQNGACFYCRTSQLDISRLLDAGLLKSKRATRGRSLEVDRINARENAYDPTNCVLACYLCNNDKSDIVSSEDYLRFFAKPKGDYLKHLLARIESPGTAAE
ncbi:MAG: hypothetical protein JNJ49_08765 [Bdellovibrionaceae bacterium]|nr:hypothetical protein [Pseudobdellovibrionaceae bacterium]